jgi:hypothetical protein
VAQKGAVAAWNARAETRKKIEVEFDEHTPGRCAGWSVRFHHHDLRYHLLQSDKKADSSTQSQSQQSSLATIYEPTYHKNLTKKWMVQF